MTLPDTLLKYARRTEKVLTDNSPAILTGLGVTGLITTALFSGKAGFRAAAIIENAESVANAKREAGKPRVKLTPKEKVDLCWKLYLPAIGVGSLSCAAIIGANRIGSRRAAAVATAYTLSERAFTEYKDKVLETVGESKEQKIRDEIAQDRVNRHESTIIYSGDDSKMLCHDQFSNQYFESDMETIRKAVNDVNAQILHNDYATVSDFYDYIRAADLEHTSISDAMGWNTDKTLEVDYTSTLYKGKKPCLSIGFSVVPIRDPWRFC